MRTVQILGTGCPKCRQLEANAREAAAAERRAREVRQAMAAKRAREAAAVYNRE